MAKTKPKMSTGYYAEVDTEQQNKKQGKSCHFSFTKKTLRERQANTIALA